MTPARKTTELVLAVCPGGRPNPRLASAAARAGALGVIDLGRSAAAARRALELTAASRGNAADDAIAVGVRAGAGCALAAEELAPLAAGLVRVVILGSGSAWRADDPALTAFRVICEVTSLDEASAAVRAGAQGLIARGSEAGGPVGELSTFVLIQQLVAAGHGVPVWAAGGIGEHTAAAAVIGGAVGVLLDAQLALLPEADLPERVAAAVRGMDGSESEVVDGHGVHRVRVLRVRGLSGAAAEPENLPAIGQDGFLAARFRDKFVDTAGAVRAVRTAILDAVRDRDAAGIFAPVTSGAQSSSNAEGSSGAQASPGALRSQLASTGFGTRLPVAQGPMTRVSDQPAFAAAVAEDGALPFLALALATGERTRTMMTETAAALGDRPWGVGVLGFAPEDVRTAQLDVIRELRPPFAIVAGGRPAQARVLEEHGISTFLHVPSPGLLRQFLEAGARKFVFEGSECGGHTGPRASFPLWEGQIGVIEDWLCSQKAASGEEVGCEVLFAGGVHDARSAAMVGAMSRKLAERGVRVGVLMGTAYLFTAEAVSCGAIQPLFQRQVVDASATALLETAPGHTTRGVVSPFTDEFERIKEQLRADDVPSRDAWQKLEELNIGRLRIASKGLRREGDDLIHADEAEQLSDGMFMAGQVAVLRSDVTTIAGLHAEIGEGSQAYYEQRASALRTDLGIAPEAVEEPEQNPEPLDVAIVGMACMFPGSPDLASFWATILDGVDRVTEVPAERWDTELYYDPEAVGKNAGRGTPSKWGGFLPPIPFDPLRYGIPPASLGSIEPVQLLALEAARRALADAGYDRRPDTSHERTSVVFGAEAGSDLSNAGVLRNSLPAYLGALPPALDEQLPRLTEDSFPGVLSNVIAGRIANRLDLGGANYTVDAACASSLTAVDVACKELTAGTSDLVLCGGADLHNGINDYLLFSSVHALSSNGRSRTFDADADGIALGEGVACVVLKRLADAERDGDRIYAVIKGVGSASDGRALGLTAPRPEGQRRALERAYHRAGISPSAVGLVEAHGTGTVVGDRIELQTLTNMFRDAGAEPGSCVLGSVKSQIGHTKCAAGLAGLIKTAMALHTAVRPPTIHLDRPNAAWDKAESPFAFHTDKSGPQPWPVPVGERVAGVSAFGFGGTNFHVVLTGYEHAIDPLHGRDEWPAELFLFRGADRAAAHRAIDRLLTTHLAGSNEGADPSPWRLRDLALTACRSAEARGGRAWVALVATDLEDLEKLARRALNGEHDPAAGLFQPSSEDGDDEGWFGDDEAKTAFLFPGQGSQRPGMLAELCTVFPELQHYVRLGSDWAPQLYPPAAFDEESRKQQDVAIRDTRVAQPALGVTGLAVDHLLRSLGLQPDAVAGHSYGELVALASAGALDPVTLLLASRERAAKILEATGGGDPGTMAAVTADAEQTQQALQAAGIRDVVLANHNSPQQTVISGPTDAVAKAVIELRATNLSAKQIPVACAFHSPLVAAGSETFGSVLDGLPVRAPEIPVYANRTAAPYPPDSPEAVRAELAAQIAAPVRFADEIEAMYAAGVRVFVEAGPGRVLTGLVGRILGDRPHLAVAPCDDRRGAGLRGLLRAVATLATAGVELNPARLFQGRDAGDAESAALPKRPGWTVDGHLVRTARDGGCVPGGLSPARRIPLEGTTMITSNANPYPDAGRPGGSNQDALLAEFLRTNREMVAAQRDVMLAYLGGATGGRLVWQESDTVPAPAFQAVAAPAMIETAAPAVTGPAAASSQAAAVPAPAAPTDILGTVLEIISARTGYPIDMIEPELDLEADLSVDSIKRTEIAGELAQRLDLGAADLDDDQMEQMAKARTARAIADWLSQHTSGSASESAESDAAASAAAAAAVPSASAAPSAPAPAADQPVADIRAPKRLEVREVEAPLYQTPDFSLLTGKRFALVGVGGATTLAEAITGELERHGASVADDEDCDGVIHLDGLADAEPAMLPVAFESIKAALARSPRWFFAVRALHGNDPAAGLRGLLRTVAREYPDVLARLVEIDGTAPASEPAAAIVAELVSFEPRHPVTLHRGGSRFALEPVEVPLGALAANGAGPAGDGVAEAQALGLDRDSVVVIVGGARGITARIAGTIAGASRCRVELIGRTPSPEAGAESPVTASAADAAAIRAALIGSGMRSPAEIERSVSATLAAREVSATMAHLQQLGARPRYHSLDVRDGEALATLLKDVHTEHGRLDAVIYAAGIIEDKVIAEKDPASFARVYGTKVDGARALFSGLDRLPSPPRISVLFGSIAAVLGNRGQSDYAAANDALESLGSAWAAGSGSRCVTIHWGPWAPVGEHGGMVTPELMQNYAKRGISLIDPEEGALAVLRELAWGPTGPADSAARSTSVIYTASGW